MPTLAHVVGFLFCMQLATVHLMDPSIAPMIVPSKDNSLMFPYNLQIPLGVEITVDSNAAEQCLPTKEYCYDVVGDKCIAAQCPSATCRYPKSKPLEASNITFATRPIPLCRIYLDASGTNMYFPQPSATLTCAPLLLASISLDTSVFTDEGGYTLSFMLNIERNNELPDAT